MWGRMMLVITLTSLLSLTVGCIDGFTLPTAVPSNSTDEQDSPEEGTLFEGDIILLPEHQTVLKVRHRLIFS